MKLGSMPIAVLMQRRTPRHRWADEAWAAVGVVRDGGDLPPVQVLAESAERDEYLVSGLELELYPDENDGYYENFMAPEAKVFVLWRMQDGRAMPVRASVSYVEGTRMFDSGEQADGVPMPAEVQAWLRAYLHAHYQPKPRRGRQHG
ncbi:DUF3305 domain-containing protein [Pseudoduganella chitinolytica]|uniref:DUF3305 domain-containing protein n=1 Tax=Pseudoduganella chitinolytica TaxID=34070 RepID=A0ABY8BK42_9BURK|nr:DUF3305 domain-containing protein [Pseudoduganella chitinolytica]WEF35323.1 DUF3305 domain-containing protein [Pseudoduganella chitinolytica]